MVEDVRAIARAFPQAYEFPLPQGAGRGGGGVDGRRAAGERSCRRGVIGERFGGTVPMDERLRERLRDSSSRQMARAVRRVKHGSEAEDRLMGAKQKTRPAKEEAKAKLPAAAAPVARRDVARAGGVRAQAAGVRRGARC